MVLQRLASMFFVLLALVLVLFLLRQLTPVNPERAGVGPRASPEALAEYRQELGLDKPVPEQFVNYLSDLSRGDFQTSIRTRRPVREDLAAYLPATLELAAAGIVVATVGGVALGMLSAARSRGSEGVRTITVAMASLPPFLLAFLLILLFSRRLGWLPGTGRTSYDNAPDDPTGLLTVDALLRGDFALFWDALRHLVLPAVTIALAPAVAIGRVLRSGLSASLSSRYVRTERAKGLTEGAIIRRHGLRNAAGPAMTMVGLQLGLMFAGVVIVEQIFAWPGIGNYTAQSIPNNDYAAITAVTLVLGAIYVVVNALVDIGQALADPRVRDSLSTT